MVDPTKGGRAADPPSAAPGSVEALNTARGLLQYKKRFDKVCVSTVYSKDKWAVRKLSDTELVDVLDLPGRMRKKMNSRQLAQLSQLKVPGKVMAVVHLRGEILTSKIITKKKLEERNIFTEVPE